MNLLNLLENAAESYSHRAFAWSDDDGRHLSFTGLADGAEGIAGGLRDWVGIRPGDHVALLLPNCLSFLPAYFGILHAGGVAVPINTRLKPAELEFILRDSDARALLVHSRAWPAAQAAIENISGPRPRLVAVDFPHGSIYPRDSLALDDLRTSGSPPPHNVNPSADDVAAIIYTSGTTGQPKGAMITHENILFNVASTQAAHDLNRADVHLLVVPLFHVTGLNTIMPTALAQGAQVVVSAQVDPTRLIGVINQFRCTTFFGVPTTFYLLANLKTVPAKSVDTLRLVCYSGAPMSAVAIHKLRELFPGVKLHNFFGLTETTSVSTVLPDNQALSRVESVGLPPPGVELAILDEQDQHLPAGEVGELVIRGPSVFKGYYKRQEATAEALRGGWFHTGDTAFLDEEGYLFLQGRKKEMVIVAGENVYPIEVENVLCGHPAVQEAAVFGRPDHFLGEVVHAAVVLRPEEEATERDLKQFLNDRLASFKLPRSIRIMDTLPRNASGKVVKRDL